MRIRAAIGFVLVAVVLGCASQRTYRRGLALLQSGRYDDAVVALSEAYHQNPDNASIESSLNEAKEKAAAWHAEQAVKADDAGDLKRAEAHWRKATYYFPNHSQYVTAHEDVYKRVREHGWQGRVVSALSAGEYAKQAERWLAQGRPGVALFYYLLVLGGDATNTEAKKSVQACTAAMWDSLRCSIALADFSAPQDAQDVIPELNAALRNGLKGRTPPAVVVLDSPFSGQPVVSDAVLAGRVVSLRVVQSKATSVGRSQYVAGKKRVRNPEYDQLKTQLQQAVADAQKAEREVADEEAAYALARTQGDFWVTVAQARVDAARVKLHQAEANVERLEHQLHSTPQEIDVDDVREQLYPFDEVKQTAILDLAVELRDAASGKVWVAETVQGVAEHRDRTVAGNAARNIAEDPLILGAPDALRRQAIAAALPKLQEAARTVVRRHGERFVLRARQAADAGRTEEAMELAMAYLLVAPAYSTHHKAVFELLRGGAGLGSSPDDRALGALVQRYAEVDYTHRPVAPVLPKPPLEVPSQAPVNPLAQRYAVIIGISRYLYSGEGGLTNLEYADDDARGFHRALLDVGWPEDHIRCLIDEQATKREVEKALGNWLTRAGKDDLIVLFWAGHGFADPVNPELVYFACYDTETREPATGYRMDHVHTALKERAARNTVVLADTCHAGRIATRGDRKIGVVSHVERLEQNQDVPPGWIYLVSAETDRRAVEHESWGHGAFTYFLLQGLMGSADGAGPAGNRDGRVTFGEIKTYLGERMREETQRLFGVAAHPLAIANTADPAIWDLSLAVPGHDTLP